jgi:hypothetical protein
MMSGNYAFPFHRLNCPVTPNSSCTLREKTNQLDKKPNLLAIEVLWLQYRAPLSKEIPRDKMYQSIWSVISWCSSWKPKTPILHRALGAGDHDASAEEQPSTTQGLLPIDELATKRRVRKRDQFQRNALHIAVCPSILIVRNRSFIVPHFFAYLLVHESTIPGSGAHAG